MSATRTILVIGYGNPGRYDDGLGPALADSLRAAELPGVTVESDYQLTVEDAADVAAHEVVIFADADVSHAGQFYFRTVTPREDVGFSSHSIQPEALMALAHRLFGTGTQGYVLGIRGYRFDDFGEGLSDEARANLAAAENFLRERLARGDFEATAARDEARSLATYTPH